MKPETKQFIKKSITTVVLVAIGVGVYNLSVIGYNKWEAKPVTPSTPASTPAV